VHTDPRAQEPTAGDRPAPTRAGSQLDAGRLLIGLGALALLISLFLDWYGDPGGGDEAINAWQSFELVDLLLALITLAALYVVVERIAAPAREPRLPDSVLVLGGPVALVLVIVSLLDEPPLVAGFDPALETGAWIALAGALVMTFGAIVSTMRISLVVGQRERGPAAGRAAETQAMTTEDQPTRQMGSTDRPRS
jgi:hypothetical protein